MDAERMAVKMTGGQKLVQALYREGVRVIFGVPGMQQYHAVDAVYREPRIRYISTRHEQATTYMADGYARVSGRARHGDGRAGAGTAQRPQRAWPPPMRSRRPCWS